MANAETPHDRRALLLIDLQKDFLADDGAMPVARGQVADVIAAARAAVEQAVGDGDLIIKIGNEFRPGDRIGNLMRRRAAIAGSAGAAWDDRAPVGPPDAAYLPKWKSSAFCNPALGELLAREGVRQVALCGLYARACVTATARGALSRGLRVTVLGDAVACQSDRSRAAALRRLARRGVEVRHAQPDAQ